MSHPLARTLTRTVTTTAALALAAPILAMAAAPAAATPRVTVTNERGGDQADTTYQTPLTIRATGFQSIKGGFGGVYLMFGWVKPGAAWQPSKGGVTGTDYKYIPDAESADNQGYLKFIAFPGSSTEAEAQAVLNAAGSFEVGLTVPGPVFQSVDRDGEVSDVDCRRVTCGIITIGAHGVKNARNETFTPVPFADVYGEAPADEAKAGEANGGDGGGGGGTAGATPPPAQPSARPSQPTGHQSGQQSGQQSGSVGSRPVPTSAGTVRRGKAALTTDRSTARAGSALAFTARGFEPGEQVLAILDDGVAALGPMIAGRSGEVAGLLQLPAELRVGTHQLRLTGAASGAAPSERFPVAAATTTSAPAGLGDEAAGWPFSRIFLGIAAAVFLLAAASAALSRTRRRGRSGLAHATGGVS